MLIILLLLSNLKVNSTEALPDIIKALILWAVWNTGDRAMGRAQVLPRSFYRL